MPNGEPDLAEFEAGGDGTSSGHEMWPLFDAMEVTARGERADHAQFAHARTDIEHVRARLCH